MALKEDAFYELSSSDLEAVQDLFDICHEQSVDMGWHENPREAGTMLMLIVSEVAEAMEGIRKGLKDDHLPDREMVEVELADAVIRIADFTWGS